MKRVILNTSVGQFFLSVLDCPYLDDIVQIISYIIRILGKCKILLGKILQNK